MTSAVKKPIKRPRHPWRVWIPKKDRPEEQSKYEKIPSQHRMGVRL